jgi:glycosyltransferase involved in cell wall biosynthesis
MDTTVLDDNNHFWLKNKKVLFITTKNIDYIRNSQELDMLKKYADTLSIIGYKDKKYIGRILKIFFRLLVTNMNGFDTIFVGFSPQLILPIWAFRFKNKLIIEDFFISLYDTMVNDRKKIKSGSILSKLLLWLDKKTLTQADVIITDTIAHSHYFIKELGADKNKIKVIYLKADHSIYYPRIISKDKLYSDKFVVMYFGSILPLQGVNVILECAMLMEDNQNIAFEIIGPITLDVQKQYGKLKNITFIPWLSQEALAQHIAKADLCLAGHFNNAIAKAKRTIPGKAYIYDSMKKPMILGDNNANRELFVEDNENYFYVEMGNPKLLKEKILFVMKKILN